MDSHTVSHFAQPSLSQTREALAFPDYIDTYTLVARLALAPLVKVLGDSMLPYATLYDDALQNFCASVRETRIKEGDEDGEAQLQQFLKCKATVQQVSDSAADLQQQTSQKYSGKKIGDKEIISQKWIDNIMGNIGNAMDIGDTLLHATPESVSMAWFCVKLGLGAIRSNHLLYSLFGSGLTSITEIMILIPVLTSPTSSSVSQTF